MSVSTSPSSPSPAQRGGKDAEPITDQEDLARLPDGPAKDPWYDHKGFFEHKLAEPNIYDQGKIKSETEALRMPNLHLTKEQVRDITTFLMGSQETSLPAELSIQAGRRSARYSGRLVGRQEVQLHGLPSVHPRPADHSDGMKQYQDVQEQLPPKLLTEGASVDPEWLQQVPLQPVAEHDGYESRTACGPT